MRTSETIADLCAALSKAQGEMKPADKDSVNPHFKSKFADLCSTVESLRLPFAKHGLSFVQSTQSDAAGDIFLETRIFHSTGQWIESTYPVRPVQNTPQGLGSAITYAKRYSISALAGVVSQAEDDDAEAAMGRPVQSQQAPPAQKTGGHWTDKYGPKNEPAPSSGPADIGDFVCSFGAKFKGKKLKDITIHDLDNYVTYIKTNAEKDGKPLRGQVLEFITNAEAFIATRMPKSADTTMDMDQSVREEADALPF